MSSLGTRPCRSATAKNKVYSPVSFFVSLQRKRSPQKRETSHYGVHKHG
jgi:hypothetical protein